MFDRIKDRRKLAEELRRRGHAVPHHDDDTFPAVFQTLMTAQMFSDMSDHFHDAPSYDSSPSVDTSSSYDSGSSFDAGGGASGGGGADGSW